MVRVGHNGQQHESQSRVASELKYSDSVNFLSREKLLRDNATSLDKLVPHTTQVVFALEVRNVERISI